MFATPPRNLLLTYLVPRWPLALALAACLTCLIGLDLAQPQIARSFIDTATSRGATSALVAAAGMYLVVAFLIQIFGVAEAYAAENLGWRATNALRADLTRHCLALDLSFHNGRTPGELIERLDGDVTVLANFFSRFVLLVVGNGLLLLGILVLLFLEDRRVGAVVLAFSAVALVVMNAVRRPGARYAQASRQASADTFGFLEERLNGLPDIQTAGGQRYVMRRLEPHLRAMVRWGRTSFLSGSLLGGATSLVFTAASAVALALGAYYYHAGSMTIGTVYLIFQHTTMVRQPLGGVTRQARHYQRAAASLGRVRQLVSTAPAVLDGPGAALPRGALSVELDGVSFAYPAAGGSRGGAGDGGGARAGLGNHSEGLLDAALRGVSFRLEAGRVLGILGRTGSGKTTIGRLLCRPYDASSGTVRLGGVDVRELRLAEVARCVAVVTQEVQLFAATVRENLTLFDPSIPDQRIVAVLEDLGLSPWYCALPGGLDTPLAPGGGLSAGEAQLLAFARVFLRDPAVVVLDEASSRLDPATEARIEHAVDRLLAGRTAIRAVAGVSKASTCASHAASSSSSRVASAPGRRPCCRRCSASCPCTRA